ncbi:hypothetical protein [Chromohalobacter sp. 296-RDG]|uniref:hypothetical protein n=1 Tax=Chromohalobacter sp. 296-RDG TaxID=2994062 RepID=UPI002469974F|nr:hypothetical protein [Chromohalobacter sp. 296-RDG]
MALYSLTYDLVKNRSYQSLYDELKSFNAIRVTESQWYFRRVNTNAAGLRDHFCKFVDSDDRVMVSQVTEWAGRNILGSPNNI